jgi:hypothetical protein
MPSEVKTYTCDYCGTPFATELQAEKHETLHVDVNYSKQILGTYLHDTKYPLEVQITFKDGTTQSYYSKET